MELNPNDIRNYEFASQMRGYDKEEVDSFLEQIAGAMEGLKEENMKLTTELASVKLQLNKLREFEDSIKNAAIDARHNADTLVAGARKEVEELLNNARKEVETIEQTAAQRITDIKKELAQMELTRKSYLTKLRELINSHLEILEEISADDARREIAEAASEFEHAAPAPSLPDFNLSDSSDNIQVSDSSEVTRESRESIANQKTEEEEAEETGAAPDVTAAGEDETTEHVHKEEEEVSTEELNDSSKVAAKADDGALNGTVDPELAAALDNYHATQQQPSQDSPLPSENVTETTARAEDVPPEFIAAAQTTEPGGPPRPLDDNNDTNREIPTAKKDGPISIANELDNIAAKFEEEMDKAAKS